MQPRRHYHTLFLLGVLLLMATSAQGQVDKRGQVGFRFLENPVSAEAVGRGGVGVTMLRNTSAVFWNPAGLAWIRGDLDASMHYTSGIADIDQLSAAAAANLGGWGVVGLSLTHMDYGTFHRTYRDYDGSGDGSGYIEDGTFSPQALAVGLAYARAMSDRFSFGIHLKLAHQDLSSSLVTEQVDEPTFRSYAMTVPAVDVGATYDFQSYGLTFGAAIQNVSQEVRYEGELFPLPFGVRFSATVEPLTFTQWEQPMHDFVVGVETSKGRDFGTRLQYGAEYSFMDVFFVRAGYMGGYSERGLTLGAGIRQYGLRFDYAFQEFGVFGSVHMLSLGYALDM